MGLIISNNIMMKAGAVNIKIGQNEKNDQKMDNLFVNFSPLCEKLYDNLSNEEKFNYINKIANDSLIVRNLPGNYEDSEGDIETYSESEYIRRFSIVFKKMVEEYLVMFEKGSKGELSSENFETIVRRIAEQMKIENFAIKFSKIYEIYSRFCFDGKINLKKVSYFSP
jgi:hypothetical protein